MKVTLGRAMGLLIAMSALGACGDSKYQCDIYSLSPYERVSTTWYEASSADDAASMCQDEHAGYDCDCYEDQ